MSKENFDHQSYSNSENSEKKPNVLGVLVQSLVAVFKYFFTPHKLTIRDARVLKEINKTTGVAFPLKSEKINKE